MMTFGRGARELALQERTSTFVREVVIPYERDARLTRHGPAEELVRELRTLYGIVDRCVQILGGMGVTRETPVSSIFRELRAFRIYDGPSEVHLYALANRIKRTRG